MLTRKIFALIFIISAATFSVEAANINLEISNVEKMTGDVLIVLFDSEKAYSSSGKPIHSAKVPADAKTLTTSFTDLVAGDYAIKLFHDENSNGKLDTNIVGLPQEGYGFSNNGGRFGPASYEEAKFTVSEDTHISIELR